MTEETLFHEALAKPPVERAAFLDAQCVGQPALRAAVEALLAAHEASGPFLDPPRQSPDGEKTSAQSEGPAAAPKSSTIDEPQIAVADVVIGGRYTLVQKIGEGGMGEVWVAKQTEPVKCRVALKLIKPGMDSRAVLARFEQERQALAIMDHPNIARVLDGGITLTGQPFFVMELVNGLPLTKFCDEARLTPKERLELFVPICQAVQHAHQKGIVHRDLKPANILVTLIDGKAVPKVIDFGVVKATGGKLTDESLSTQFGTVVGTLEYMAPEQAGYSGTDIDTRADIYSLGVILYEMLTGLRPIDAKRLKQAVYTEMIRIIREEEPSKPSTRLSTDEALPSLAALRRTEPKKLMALLRGELDWVVMKCLEKNRERRYESANGLARDVQRYLADEPVEARPPSAGYRLSKFLTRNKGPVVAAGLVLLALIAGIVGTAYELIRAEKALVAESLRAEGERLAKQDAEAQKQKALEEKQIAQAVRDFLQNKLLGQADLDMQADDLLRAGGSASDTKKNPTIRELLDRAAKELAGDEIEINFPHQPLLQAEILKTLGDTYRGIGEFKLSIACLQRSVLLRRQHLGAEDPSTLASLNSLAMAYHDAGRLHEAIALYEQIRDALMRTGGAEFATTLITLNNLAGAYKRAGRPNDAIALYEQVRDIQVKRLGADHPTTLTTLNGLASTYWSTKNLDKSIPLFEAVLKGRQAKLGRQHPNTQRTVANLGVNYKDAGRLKEAIPLLEEAYRTSRTFPPIAWVSSQLFDAYKKAGMNAEGAKLVHELLDQARKDFPKDSPQLAGNLAQYGWALLQFKVFADAEPILRECLGFREKIEPELGTTFNTQAMLGGALLGQKKYAEAEQLLLKGYEGMKQREAQMPPNGKARLTEAATRLVQLYEAMGKKDEAAKWRREMEACKRAEAAPEGNK